MRYLQAQATQSEKLGPYGSMAIFDLFQASILDQTGTLSSDIEQVYKSALDKARAHLAEYQRQRRMIADLVATQESTLARLTEETEGTSRELASQQILLEES